MKLKLYIWMFVMIILCSFASAALVNTTYNAVGGTYYASQNGLGPAGNTDNMWGNDTATYGYDVMACNEDTEDCGWIIWRIPANAASAKIFGGWRKAGNSIGFMYNLSNATNSFVTTSINTNDGPEYVNTAYAIGGYYWIVIDGTTPKVAAYLGIRNWTVEENIIFPPDATLGNYSNASPEEWAYNMDITSTPGVLLLFFYLAVIMCVFIIGMILRIPFFIFISALMLFFLGFIIAFKASILFGILVTIVGILMFFVGAMML